MGKKVVVFVGGIFLLVLSVLIYAKGISFPAMWIVGAILAVAAGLSLLTSGPAEQEAKEMQERRDAHEGR